jgi:hypothetical protein
MSEDEDKVADQLTARVYQRNVNKSQTTSNTHSVERLSFKESEVSIFE